MYGDVTDANGDADGKNKGVRRYTASALSVFDGLLLTSPAYTKLTSCSVKQKALNFSHHQQMITNSIFVPFILMPI